MKTPYLTPAELRRRVHAVVAKELGPVALLRYLHDNFAGSGNYTEERRELLPDGPVEELYAEIMDRERKRSKSRSRSTKQVVVKRPAKSPVKRRG